MNHTALVASVLALSSVAIAQVATTFKVQGGVSVSALDSRYNPTTLTAPGGTDLKQGLFLPTKSGSSAAQLQVTYSETLDRVTAKFDTYGLAGYALSSGQAGWSVVNCDSRIALNTGAEEEVVVYIDFTYSWQDNHSYSVSLRVNDVEKFSQTNGSSKAGNVEREIPISIPKGGANFDIRVNAGGSGFYPTRGSVTLSLRVDVRVRGADFGRYGLACGPTLSGTRLFGDQVRLEVIGAPANSSGVLIVGSRLFASPLPGTDCFLRTDPMASMAIAISPTGTWSLTKSVPMSCRPLAALVQVGTLGTKLQTTNGLLVDIPK